jgi:hypothetical protein
VALLVNPTTPAAETGIAFKMEMASAASDTSIT